LEISRGWWVSKAKFLTEAKLIRNFYRGVGVQTKKPTMEG